MSAFKPGQKVKFVLTSRHGRTPPREGVVIETLRRANGEFVSVQTPDGKKHSPRPLNVTAVG